VFCRELALDSFVTDTFGFDIAIFCLLGFVSFCWIFHGAFAELAARSALQCRRFVPDYHPAVCLPLLWQK
jgi:hypothetical protein